MNSLAVKLLGLLKTNVGVLPRRWAHLHRFKLDFLNKPTTGCRLLGLAFIGRKTANKLLQLRNTLLALGVCRHKPRTRLRRRQHVVVVIAGIDSNIPIVDIGHVRTYRVKKMTIVGNDDHGAITIIKKALKPAYGVNV